MAINHLNYCILGVFPVELARLAAGAVLLVKPKLDLVTNLIVLSLFAVLVRLFLLFNLGFGYASLN